MNTIPGQNDESPRSTSHLEREGDELRADLDRTLDALERKFSPGQLVDRSVEFLRTNGSQLVNEVGDSVRSHPLPILLTAAGLIWLTASVVTARSAASARQPASGRHGSRQQFRTTRADAGARARSVMDSTADRIKNRASGTVDAVHEQVDRVQGNLASMVREQPLALGAMAVAAGAILGAALPMTQYENRMMSRARDRTLAKADEIGQRQYEKVRESLAGNGSNDEGRSAMDSADAGSQSSIPASIPAQD